MSQAIRPPSSEPPAGQPTAVPAAASRGGSTEPEAGAAIVEDGVPVEAGQVAKGEFLDHLRAELMTMVESETRGTVWEGRGCPWIDHHVERYRRRPVADARDTLRRYIGSDPRIATTEQLRAAVTRRARDSLREWLATGRTPTVPGGTDTSATTDSIPTGEPGSPLLRWPTPGAGPISVDAVRTANRLGPGEPLPSDVARRFAPELGPGLGAVRVHRGSLGAAAAGAAQAHAFALGPHVAFGPDRFAPGTPAGDALIAHELAHATALGEGGTVDDAEHVADGVAASAVERLWAGSTTTSSSFRPRAPRGGLAIRRCGFEERVEPEAVGDEEMRSLGWSIRAPETAVVGQGYRVELIDPGSSTPSIGLTGRPLPLASWYAKRPGDSEFGRRAPELGSSHTWTLDNEGNWSFAAETYLGRNRYGILIHTVVVRRPDQVATERLSAVRPTTVTAFLIGLEQQNLTNIRVGVTDQRFAPAYITLQGANPAQSTASWPNLPRNVYAVHPPPGVVPARYQWLAVPTDLAQYPAIERFGQKRRTIDGRDGFDLGTGPVAGWTISMENGIVEIYCRISDAGGVPVAEARYRQVVLDAAESEHAQRFQSYMGDVRAELAHVREDAIFVPAVHLGTENGTSTELSFFLGRAVGADDLVLVDLTPGVPRRKYGGRSWSDVLGSLNDGNGYPAGQIVLKVPANPFGVATQPWRLVTSGASLASRLSTAWGWASLGLAGFGALAAVVAPPLAPVFFLASGAVGAASTAASLYQRSQEAHPSSLAVAVDIANLAGSLIGLAGAVNILRYGPRVAAATRSGQFVLYAGFATEAVGGVFIAVEGATQIADVLSSSQRRDDQVAAVVRILSGMLLTGTLLAWRARDVGATRTALEATLGAQTAGRLAPADLHALGILDDATLAGLRSVEESSSVAALIREDPVRASRLAQVHGGRRFLERARSGPGSLQALADALDLERRAALIGLAASRLGQPVDAVAVRALSAGMGVQVRIDATLTGSEILAEYRVGSWLSGTEIEIRVSPGASVGDVLLHQLTIDGISEYRVLSGDFRGLYDRARTWLRGRTLPRAQELVLELDKHAAMHEARLLALRRRPIGSELEQQLAQDIGEIGVWVARFRGELGALGAPQGVIGAWFEGYSQGQLERLVDAPGSGLVRSTHPSTGTVISEPGFRGGTALNMGRKQALAARRLGGATFPDVFATESATGRQLAMELKTVRPGDSVATHFRQPMVSRDILREHGGRIDNLPPGTPSYLVVDIRQANQSIPQALSDLSTVLRNYADVGDARRLWSGVRFMTGPTDAPILSGVYTIP